MTRVPDQLVSVGDYGRIGNVVIERCLNQHNEECVRFLSEMTIDADGCPSAYHRHGSPPGLDYLANAGSPGNWWGIALNRDGRPFVQGEDDPCPGYFVSTTSLKHKQFAHGDPRREIDSLIVPYLVCPAPLLKRVKGIILGCRGFVRNIHTNLTISGVVADIGPAKHAGEASMAMAKAHGVQSSPKWGGSSKHIWEYVFFPGVEAEGFELQPFSP